MKNRSRDGLAAKGLFLFDTLFSCPRLQEDNLIIQNTVLEEDTKTSFGLDTD